MVGATVLRREGRADREADPWPDLPPSVEAREHLPVRAIVRGQLVDAVVLGWRGERVYLTWRSDMGKHLG